MIKQDYLLQIIEQLGAALRRMKKRDDSELEGALQEVGALYERLLGLDPLLVQAMSIQTVAMMLRSPLELPVLAAILAQEGALLADSNSATAEVLGRRALWVLDECAAQDILVPEPCIEALVALGQAVTTLSLEVRAAQARLRTDA